jgi:hypothetical protein
MIMSQENVYTYSNVGILYHLMDYVQSNLETQRLTLITKSTNTLSLTSKQLIQCFLVKYSSILLEINSIVNKSSSKEILLIKNLFGRRDESFSTKILFLDISNDINIEQELIIFINFLVNNTAKIPRSKCLIFLINKHLKSVEIKEFFKYSWFYEFLDITVIEIMERNVHNTMLISLFKQTNIILHAYNPFSNTYIKEYSIKKSNLFTDKLKNLHKIPIPIGANEYFPNVLFPKEFNQNNIWEQLNGCDVLLTNILAEKLNFTIELKIIFSEDIKLKLLNSSYSNLADPLNDNFINYVVNIDYVMGTQSLEEYSFSPGLFLEQGSFYFIVKQYSNSKIKFSENFIVILAIFIVIAVISICFVRLVNFNNKIWSIYNITQILIGTSIINTPERVSQRILFAFISFVSLTFTSSFMEQLFNIYIDEQEFLDLTTLKNLIDSGIIPSISKHTQKFYASTINENFQHILSISKLIDNKYANIGASKCIIQMINDLDNVRGCETDQILGIAVAKRFSENINGWILSLVKEPFATGVSVTVHTKTSPYIKKFNQIIRCLYDTGIIQYLKDYAIRNYSLDHKEFFQYGYNQYVDLENEKPVKKEIFSGSVIIISFFISYVIAALIFSYEIFVKNSTRHKRKATILNRLF